MEKTEFDLATFLPYVLNRAAEKTSEQFESVYKKRYGMLRMEWRVLFHLGRYGPLTAKDICIKGDLHKTKVSRAVAALEDKRFLSRNIFPDDRRYELLVLSVNGQNVYNDLCHEAAHFHDHMVSQLPDGAVHAMINALNILLSPSVK